MLEHHALGVAGRARRVDHLEQVVAGWPWPRVELCLPVGRERVVEAALVLVAGALVRRIRGQPFDGADAEVIQAGLVRIGRVHARADGEPLGVRFVGDPLDDVRCHAQVERDDDEAGAHRAVVDGGQRGGRRAPGEQPIPGVQAEAAEAPGRELGAVAEILGRPGKLDAVVGAQRELALARPARGGVVEDVEQRVELARVGDLPGRGHRSGSVCGGVSCAAAIHGQSASHLGSELAQVEAQGGSCFTPCK